MQKQKEISKIKLGLICFFVCLLICAGIILLVFTFVEDKPEGSVNDRYYNTVPVAPIKTTPVDTPEQFSNTILDLISWMPWIMGIFLILPLIWRITRNV